MPNLKSVLNSMLDKMTLPEDYNSELMPAESEFILKNSPDVGYFTAYVKTLNPCDAYVTGTARSKIRALQFAHENYAKWLKEQE